MIAILGSRYLGIVAEAHEKGNALMGEACGSSGVLSTEQVLCEEVDAIHSKCLEGETGTKLNRSMNELGSSALCLSGGGVRSAAFALGVIQAFATHPRSGSTDPEPAYGADTSILAKFHYMSTVSGGGYIGSWLSAWLLVKPFREVRACLVSRPEGPTKLPLPLAALYSLSSYLTPRTGIMSANTFTAIGLSLRNVLLNWLVIVPPIAALILLVKLIGMFSVWLIEWENVPIEELWAHPVTGMKFVLELASAAIAVVLLMVALVWTSRARPSFKVRPGDPPGKADFLRGPLLCSILSAVLLVHFLGSDFAGMLFLTCQATPLPTEFHGLKMCGEVANSASGWLIPRLGLSRYMAAAGVAGAVVYAGAWLVSRAWRGGWRDLGAWALAGAVYGASVALGFYGYLMIPAGGFDGFPTHFMHLSFGVPWVLMSQTLASMVFVGLASHGLNSEADREWFGRGTGWFLLIAVTWLSVMFIVFFGDLLNWFFAGQKVVDVMKGYMPFVVGISGFVTALLGKSSMISATAQQRGFTSYALSLVLPIAAIIFVAALLMIISFVADQMMFGGNLIPDAQPVISAARAISGAGSSLAELAAQTVSAIAGAGQTIAAAGIPWTDRLVGLSTGIVVLLLMSAVTSRAIDINRFSLHSIYRNRLIRAFLGAPRQRDPDPLTDFDPGDSPEMRRLWSASRADGPRLFHVINIAHGAAPTGGEQAWQERRTGSFTASPLHCGSAALGYRRSSEYGAPSGITLGTAMAISGAAASPNMGYHPSAPITFLLTMFGARLGWWLGNPGESGKDTCRTVGPKFAIKPLVQEALGLTTAKNDYVFLSDGGHFDNLGLYEMVRRRCRFIVISDAGWDPHFDLDDLADSIRKIKIELGIGIRFQGLEHLKPRPEKHTDVRPDEPYHALGEIDYRAADGGGENGFILYIKAGYHGVESVGVRGYANAYDDFPHEATVDQWVTRSQFESYRELGFEITSRIVERALAHPGYAADPTMNGFFAALRNDEGARPA